MSTATLSAPTFVWDRNYGNYDQVAPYFAAYSAIYDELTEAGKYPYNDSFKGQIPGLIDSDREDTAIYMLQQMRHRNEMQVEVDAFVARGAVPVDQVDMSTKPRGTIVQYGFYVGGSGYQVLASRARLVSLSEHTDSKGQTRAILGLIPFRGKAARYIPTPYSNVLFLSEGMA